MDIINKLVIPQELFFLKVTQSQFENPANGSGRHRNYALQMLCATSNVEWEDIMKQKIWVDKMLYQIILNLKWLWFCLMVLNVKTIKNGINFFFFDNCWYFN